MDYVSVGQIMAEYSQPYPSREVNSRVFGSKRHDASRTEGKIMQYWCFAGVQLDCAVWIV